MRRALAILTLFAFAALVHAQAPSYQIDELYSSADGSVQYVVLREALGQSQQQGFAGRQLVVTGSGWQKTFSFAHDLPSPATANTRVLIGSVGFQALGVVAPDFVMPDRFLPVDGGTLNFAGVDAMTYASLPTDGATALYRSGGVAPNLAMNFAGRSGAAPARSIMVVEFHHAGLDHYFISPLAPDIDALDSGRIAGWGRTGFNFVAAPSAAAGGPDVNPVCRFYIPPNKGDSHFFSASPVECADVLNRIPTDPDYAGFQLETLQAFFIALPNLVSGVCAAGTVSVYRLWNRRTNSTNHRYTTDRAVRAAMIAQGYISEGYGPDGVAMCARFTGTDVVVKVSGTSPYAPGCSPLSGTLYLNSEVEPYVAINPVNPSNLIGVWQQDRWSNGSAQGVMTGVSFDGGTTWERRIVPFSHCAGGNAGNGGDYQRATDPWVTFAADGTAYQIALTTTGTSFTAGSANAMSVSRSTDGGRSWSNPHALIVDGQGFFNDKEAITADPTDARLVFASWDRLRQTGINPATFGGTTMFARTIDRGATWEPARAIHDPGPTSQTINNIPVVLANGTLVNFFTRIDEVNGQNVSTLQLMHSPDKGATWLHPITINAQQAIGAADPENGTRVRDGTLIASIAASRDGQLALVWQDSRFSSGVRDGIAFSRSFDGGFTWTPPVRVNRDPLVPAFIPTVAIRDDGTIGVTYYDFRSNTADPARLETDYWLAQTTDGVTWRESRVAGPFDLSIAPNANGLFIGDYMSMVTRGTDFLPFFGTTNNGNLGNRSDISIAVMNSPGFAPGVAAMAKRHAMLDDDPAMYRTETRAPLVMSKAFAARHGAAIREAMQRRVPGWESPGRPAGTRAARDQATGVIQSEARDLLLH